MKPIIAMPQMEAGLMGDYMKNKYVLAVESAGGQVKWIPWGSGESAIQTAEGCDGLLLPGGDDINPAMYGMEKSDKCGKQNQERDELEPALFKAFFNAGKPILGICRGMQMINVCCGGTMQQDIKDAQKVKHIRFLKRKNGSHTVAIADGTLLKKITDSHNLTVNSLHHQAANKIGINLVVNAVSEDGFVEGLDHTQHPFCIGVQWHPEHMAQTVPVQQKIITEFVNRCKK